MFSKIISKKILPLNKNSSLISLRTISTPNLNPKCKFGEKSEFIFKREEKYGAHNYHPLPVALEKASGKKISLLINVDI